VGPSCWEWVFPSSPSGTEVLVFFNHSSARVGTSGAKLGTTHLPNHSMPTRPRRTCAIVTRFLSSLLQCPTSTVQQQLRLLSHLLYFVVYLFTHPTTQTMFTVVALSSIASVAAFSGMPLHLRRVSGMKLSAAPLSFNEGSARDFLLQQQVPPGLRDAFVNSMADLPLRFFIIDDSGRYVCSLSSRIPAGASVFWLGLSPAPPQREGYRIPATSAAHTLLIILSNITCLISLSP
jgi:hypothetical protein